MEYFPHGDLERFLGQNFSELETSRIASQVAKGLGFMHRYNFIHRDLKPGVSYYTASLFSWTLMFLPSMLAPAPANSETKNLLVFEKPPEKEWWVKISDFGISKRSTDGNEKYSTVIGTHEYMAPEIHFRGRGDKASYTVAADMWSLGALCVRMMTGKPAFDPAELFGYYRQGQAFVPEHALKSNGTSQDGRNFIREIMGPVPQLRLSAQEAAKHPWTTFSYQSLRDINEPSRYGRHILPSKYNVTCSCLPPLS